MARAPKIADRQVHSRRENRPLSRRSHQVVLCLVLLWSSTLIYACGEGVGICVSRFVDRVATEIPPEMDSSIIEPLRRTALEQSITSDVSWIGTSPEFTPIALDSPRPWQIDGERFGFALASAPGLRIVLTSWAPIEAFVGVEQVRVVGSFGEALPCVRSTIEDLVSWIERDPFGWARWVYGSEQTLPEGLSELPRGFAHWLASEMHDTYAEGHATFSYGWNTTDSDPALSIAWVIQQSPSGAASSKLLVFDSANSRCFDVQLWADEGDVVACAEVVALIRDGLVSGTHPRKIVGDQLDR